MTTEECAKYFLNETFNNYVSETMFQAAIEIMVTRDTMSRGAAEKTANDAVVIFNRRRRIKTTNI